MSWLHHLGLHQALNERSPQDLLKVTAESYETNYVRRLEVEESKKKNLTATIEMLHVSSSKIRNIFTYGVMVVCKYYAM